MRDLVRQTTTCNCGAAVVAMVLESDIETAVSLLGHDGPTVWAHLRDALRAAGRCASERLQRITIDGRQVPRLAVLRVYWPAVAGKRDESHWVLRDGERVLDPYYGELLWGHVEKYCEYGRPRTSTRVTSFGAIDQ